MSPDKERRYPLLWAALPADVRRKHIVDNGVVHVIDVAPAGSELVITAETHDVTSFSDIREKER